MIPELNGDFLQWLRGFYYVAKTGSVRAASELMHRNPSTISYQIRSLEEELHTVLFDRYKKRLQITPEGQKLLIWTISTFETLQSMRSAVGTSDGHLQGDIHIGATLPIAIVAADAFADFHAVNPDVNIHILRSLSHEIVQSVQESRIDFGLTGLTTLPKTDHMEICLKSRPMLILPRDNSWSLPAIPTEEDLAQLPFVIFQSEQHDEPYPTLHSAAHTLQKKTAMQANNHHLILQLVRRGVGAAIMDELCYRATLYGSDWSSLISIPIDHLLPNVLYGILVRRHKHISPQAEALMAKLREHFARVAALPMDQLGKTPKNESADEKTAKTGKMRKTEKRPRTEKAAGPKAGHPNRMR